MPDYSKGKIYTIRCRNDDTLIYVGSTIQPLSKRWGCHKTKSKTNGDRLLYSTIGDNWTDWFIELYQEYPCENKEQLDRREGEVIREIGTLNMCIAGRTKKEYIQLHTDKIKEYQKDYRQANAEKKKQYMKDYRDQDTNNLKEKKKQYYQANADKIKEKKRECYQKKKLEKQQNMVQQN